MKGYKVFNSDWTCRAFQYEVGKTYTHNGDLELCDRGFHFCEKAIDCFNYYSFDSDNKVAEIEAIGDVQTEGDKSVTNNIKIIRELLWHEVLNIVNTGKDNTGKDNTGKDNTGYRNSGYGNSGYGNSGDWNSGDWNSGDRNSGDRNSGAFCNKATKILLFNKSSSITLSEWRNTRAYNLLARMELTEWIYENKMTDTEKQKKSNHKILNGYLKRYKYKEACQIMWDSFTDEEKEVVKNIENFDAEVFFDITGIMVYCDKEVTK